MKRKKIKIVIPLFDDWENFNIIVKKIQSNNEISQHDIEIILVNDHSTTLYQNVGGHESLKITLIDLVKNFGNQKAISIGLRYLHENYQHSDYDHVIVMDSDGEDKAEDIENLIKASDSDDQIVFARRGKRNENFLFKFFYFTYKKIFKLFTGKSIDVGNFSCIPAKLIKTIVSLQDIDLHYAASVIKSKINYKKVDCNKGQRMFGQTKLSFHRHLLHGLISLSLFAEVIAVNIFFSSILSMFFLIIFAAMVLISKIFFNFVLIGWTSIILISSLSLFFILFLLCIFSLIILLNKNSHNQSSAKFINKNFIESIKSL